MRPERTAGRPGRGGAVILPKDCEILYLNDSKKLSAAKREALYDEIMEKAAATGIGMAGPARIDEINILQATYEAMREAVAKLGVQPGILLNDAVTIPRDQYSPGADHQGGREERFHRCGEHPCKGDERQAHGAV